jgi:GDPmannose 4,6-dehydratase
MWRILQHHEPDDFVVATGEMRSLLDFVNSTFEHLGLDPAGHFKTDGGLIRPADIARSVGDSSKAKRLLGWQPTVSFEMLIRKLVEAQTGC